jgi:predicted Zn-dependent protease with MMP-like domain
MTEAQREEFDAILEDVIDGLPRSIGALLNEVSLVVMDRPTPEMVEELRRDGLLTAEEGGDADGGDLCGLHTGTGLTERSVEDSGVLPDQIHLFRDGIAALALEEAGLGWGEPAAAEAIYEETRTTLLHEIGHHFGLDEGDLDELGYA